MPPSGGEAAAAEKSGWCAYLKAPDLGFRVEGLGFGIWGLGFRVRDVGFRFDGLGSKV